MRFPVTLMIVAISCSQPAFSQSVNGPAEAIDGDTLDLTGVRVRLLGIDAVEAKQTCDRVGATWSCGEDARSTLAKLIEGKQVSCQGSGNDVYGRLLAVCRSGAIDLGEAMVAAGLAIASSEFSPAYVEHEKRAKGLRLGIWASDFERPKDWRASHRDAESRPTRKASTAPTQAPRFRDDLGRCAIKGNHSRKGEWIYHLPGQAYYDQTRPEARFCTEGAAQRAGYRPSKV